MLGILAAAAFVTSSTTNGLKGYSLAQLLFVRDMILLIKFKMDWELIHQQNQMKISKDNIIKNSKIVYHDYKVGYKFMINNNTDLRYNTPYKGPF